MRRFLIATAALLSLAAPAVAVPACSNPADQSAWEVLALRRMMSVIATKNCGKEREYNEYFIKRFQPIIQDNDRKVQAYFRRVYGGAGRGRMDIFETELANIMSQQANRQAGEFCSPECQHVPDRAALGGGSGGGGGSVQPVFRSPARNPVVEACARGCQVKSAPRYRPGSWRPIRWRRPPPWRLAAAAQAHRDARGGCLPSQGFRTGCATTPATIR